MQLHQAYFCILGAFIGIGSSGCQLLISDGSGGAGSTGTHATGSSTGTGTATASSGSGSTSTGGLVCSEATCTQYCRDFQTNCKADVYKSDDACCDTCAVGAKLQTKIDPVCLDGYANNTECAKAGPIGFMDSCGTTADNYCNMRKKLCPNTSGGCDLPSGTDATCVPKVLALIATARARGASGSNAGCAMAAGTLCTELTTPATICAAAATNLDITCPAP